jgi:SAM-dependent methyltransferase
MSKFETLLPEIISSIESCVLSNPKADAQYTKIKIHRNEVSSNTSHNSTVISCNSSLCLTEPTFFLECFTEKQAFQKTLHEESLMQLLFSETGIHYKNVFITTSSENITILISKKGRETLLRKPRLDLQIDTPEVPVPQTPHNKQKNYLLQEGIPISFLVQLGVMTKQGKIINSKYNKFKQINRYLEFVDDVIENLIITDSVRPLQIVDFGCGKSYLTFALYHYLTEIKGIQANIIGLDLKEDVIETCSILAKNFGYTGLHFSTGDIASYSKDNPTAKDPDMIITLHACDTATDYALAYAVEHNAKVILSVPCCQHELNCALSKQAPNTIFNSLLKYGLVKERFAALATDVMRAELLEQHGYNVQLLEFIDMSHTPKNILIRAVQKTPQQKPKSDAPATIDYKNLCAALGQKNKLAELLKV